MSAMSGGCQCRRIRYTAEIESNDAYLCHCKMCRHATGGASIAFVNVPIEKVRWESEPDWFRSSPIARRPFCSTCGTPLGFAFIEDGKNIDLTLGSFDDPTRFVPQYNHASESILPVWQDTSGLPGIPTKDNPGVVTRWQKATGHVPD